MQLDISVIQGSILGPILFLCNFNDFYSATALFSVLFSDDTTCLSKGKKLNELIEFVTSELQKIANSEFAPSPPPPELASVTGVVCLLLVFFF
jgi:hypothetical protein